MNEVFTAGAWVGAPMSLVIGTAGAIFCGSVVALLLGFLVFRLFLYRQFKPDLSLKDFSLARYQPMVRLLSADDLEFLASQPGSRPKILTQLKRDRRRIFRMYLRELAGDFQALHAEARKIAADSPEQHSELVGTLLAQQVTFWKAIAAIELRLMLPRTSGMDISELIASVEALRLDVARMAA